MIVVKIKAGLGNQMFQYALGKRLYIDWQDKLKFDLSWFDNIQKGETVRELEINKFAVSLDRATEAEVAAVQPSFLQMTIARIRGKLNQNYFYSFFPSILKKKENVYLDGYFQSYKYFDSIKEILWKDFTLKNGFSKDGARIKDEIDQAQEPVAIHVRRGDFAAMCKNWNGTLGSNYYQTALQLIRKNYEPSRLFVFSDDIEWAKENLKFDIQTVFVSRPELNAVEEMMLISTCKHQIIANSTFSWWGAWLNKNENKVVVAPTRWLVAANIDTKDLLPPQWLRC